MTKTPIYRYRPAEVLSGAAGVLFLYHSLASKLSLHLPPPPPRRLILYLGLLLYQPTLSSEPNSAWREP
jgi:hypothetical protein